MSRLTVGECLALLDHAGADLQALASLAARWGFTLPWPDGPRFARLDLWDHIFNRAQGSQDLALTTLE